MDFKVMLIIFSTQARKRGVRSRIFLIPINVAIIIPSSTFLYFSLFCS